MTFARPEFLWLALLVLPEVAVSLRRAPRLRASLEQLAGPARRERAGATYAALAFLGAFAGALFIASTALAAAGPSWGRRGVATERAGLEVAFVLDVSRSMASLDGAPTRLETAKSLVRSLARGPGGAGGPAFALVAMKGDGLLLLPMTEDLDALDSALEYADAGAMTSPGTNLEGGIEAGLSAFTSIGGGGKLIVLLADGGESGGSSLKAAREAGRRNARLLVVGVGGANPVPVPGPDGRPLIGASGEQVRTALDAGRLKALAAAGGGRYLESSDPGASAALAEEIASASGGGSRVEYLSVDRSGIFAFAALAALAALVLVEALARRGGIG